MAKSFDVPRVVDAYRKAVKQCDAAITKRDKTAAEKIIRQLRAEWVKGNGGDAEELHETAFGG